MAVNRRIQIAVVNESTVLADADVADITSAVQHQIGHDFFPNWGTIADLHIVDSGTDVDDMWVIAVLDDADQAGALGYHDLTKQLHPISKVFAKTTQEDGAEVSVTFSHEALEMLGDSYVNQTALDPNTGRLYAYENADAVEADELGYRIGNVLVSDFVLPTYFDPQHKGKDIPVDFCGHTKEPFSLCAGGYLSYLDLDNLKKGWQQETADTAPVTLGAREAGFPPGSRRERRTRAWKGELVVSTAV